MQKTPATKPFRIVDLMFLVAATAAAFAVFRYGRPTNLGLSTFGTTWEVWLFYWAHLLVPFPAFLSLAVCAIAWWATRKSARRAPLRAGVFACYAATGAIAVASLISTAFYVAHLLEDDGYLPKIFSHPTRNHPPPPFGSHTIEEIGGAAVLGAWLALSVSRRWRTEPCWIDRFGLGLGVTWIILFLIFVYGFSG
jgi:hypothetical protein